MTVRSFAFLLLSLSIPAIAADPPHPPALPGETRTNMASQIKGQFAPPLTLNDGSALIFLPVCQTYQESGCQNEIAIQKFFPAEPQRNSTIRLTGVGVEIERTAGGNNQHARYASLATPAGIWLIGPSIHLLRPDGSVVSGKLTPPRQSVHTVALPDGSVMVLGGLSWPSSYPAASTLKVERVWLDAKGVIRSEDLPSLPVKLGNPGTSGGTFGRFGALHIGGGQVLVTGNANHKSTLLYDPAAKKWLALPAMLMPRNDPALARLPDGRVWATGGEGHIWGGAPVARGRDLSVSTTSEFWDPKQRVWQRGPDLPVSMQDHQAVWVADEGAVLLGAGRFPVLLAWKPGDEAVRIAAQMGIERRGGALVPLSGRRVGGVSGLSARVNANEAYGRRSPGASVVAWTAAPASSRSGTWQIANDGGLSVRGDRLLAAGGTLRNHHDGSVKYEVTRLAELWQGAGGQTVSLPALPFDTRRAEVAWVDEQRALIHESGQLALLDVKTQDYRLLDAAPLSRDGFSNRADYSRLVGINHQRAWLISENAAVYWLDVNSGRITEGPRLQRQRQNFVGRVLNDGRVIVAGGVVEGEIVASRPADCADCSPGYIGWGPYLPARRHEIYDPVRKNWHSSSPSRAAGGAVASLPEKRSNNEHGGVPRVAILASGQVVKAGQITRFNNEAGYMEILRVELEISSPDGATWRTLPFPEGQSPENPCLLVPLGNGGLYPDALFLGVWEATNKKDFNHPWHWRWWWLPSANAPNPVWREIGTAIPPYVFPAGEIPLDAENGPAWAMGSAAGVMVYSRNKSTN